MLSLLRTHNGFKNLFYGQAISQVGDALFYVSFMFMVEKITGNLAMVGYVGAAETLPFFLFGPYSGVLADRIDRRKILLWSDLLSAAVLLGMALLAFVPTLFRPAPTFFEKSGLLTMPPVVPGWTLILAGFCLATIRTFFFPAKNASIPRLLPTEDLQRGFALSIGAQNLMFMIGTAFAATVMAQMYEAFSMTTFFIALMLVNALSFGGSAMFIAKLPKIEPEKEGEHEKALPAFISGLKFIHNRKDLITLMITAMVFGLSVAPFFVTYVAANKEWFGGKPGTLAWCEFSFFIGMVVASGFVGKHSPKLPGRAFIIGAMIVGVAVGLMALSKNFYLFCFWNVVCGLAVPYIDIPMRSYLQATVPDEFRGRVNSVQSMTTTAVMPIGMASAGSLLKTYGLFVVFSVMGAAMVLASMIGLSGREFRNAKMPESPGKPAEADPVSDDLEFAASA